MIAEAVEAAPISLSLTAAVDQEVAALRGSLKGTPHQTPQLMALVRTFLAGAEQHERTRDYMVGTRVRRDGSGLETNVIGDYASIAWPLSDLEFWGDIFTRVSALTHTQGTAASLLDSPEKVFSIAIAPDHGVTVLAKQDRSRINPSKLEAGFVKAAWADPMWWMKQSLRVGAMQVGLNVSFNQERVWRNLDRALVGTGVNLFTGVVQSDTLTHYEPRRR